MHMRLYIIIIIQLHLLWQSDQSQLTSVYMRHDTGVLAAWPSFVLASHCNAGQHSS
jgi:hypothetical protein